MKQFLYKIQNKQLRKHAQKFFEMGNLYNKVAIHAKNRNAKYKL